MNSQLKEFYATVRLAFKEIEVITRLLRTAKVHPKIDPPPQPADVNNIVEVPLTVKVQGKDNLGIVQEIIIGNKKNPRAEIITGFSELSSSPLEELAKFLIERGWETVAILVSSIASIYGTFYVLAYHFQTNMSLEWFNHAELLALGGIPAFVDLCYAAAWRKKSALKIEQEEENSSSVTSTKPSNSGSSSGITKRCAV